MHLLKTIVELKQYSKKSYKYILKGLRMMVTLSGEDRKIGWGKPHIRIKVDSKVVMFDDFTGMCIMHIDF